MKKFLRTGKRTLSVFMAVLMAFTALVFAAPQKASAVDTGKYYVRVKCNNQDAKNAKGSYTAPWQDKNGGYSVNGDYDKAKNSNGRTSYNSGGGYTIFYKNASGTETWSKSTVVDIESFYYKDAGNEGKSTTFTTAVDGFPTKIQYYNCESDGFSIYEATWYIEEIEVANNKDMTGATTIWSGTYGATSHTFARAGYIYPNASNGKTEMTMPKGGWSSSKKTTNSGFESKWVSPTPSKIDWISASESNLTISTGSNTVSRDFKFNILDQYGVVMSTKDLKAANADPVVSITATNFEDGTVSKSNAKNLYYTYENDSDNYTATVSAKPALKSEKKGINSYEVTVNVSVPGTGISESKEFTIYDPKYTVFFDANGGNPLAPASTEVYYGESLASQAKLDNTSNYPTGGTYAGHSWLGLFDGRTGGNPMNPDAAVTASRTYYAHWDENTYVVVFLDKNGKCVDIQYVGHGKKVDDKTAKEEIEKDKYPTSDKHFTFKEWDQDISSVSSNMIVNAVYNEAAHTFDAGVDVAANCQHGAGKEYTCTVCGYKKVNETSSVKGDHTLTGLIQDVAPTCTETGKGHKECTVCGEFVEADTEIPALGHSYKIEEKTPATCAKEGERTLTCTRCGETHTEKIPKKQHSYVKVNTVPATCNSSAYDVMECAVCKDSYKLYLGVASSEHTWTEKYDKATGVLTLTCSVCGTVKTVDIGANLENFVSADVKKDPTCKEDGVVEVTAGDNKFTVAISKDKIPHKYETEVTPATCMDDGKIINVCTVCGQRDDTNAKTIAKLGHDYVEGVTTSATCTTAGVKTISCKRDGCTYRKTEAIPATGHKVSEVVVDCTSGGKIKCVNCGEEIADIPAKDHDYSGSVRIEEATCDKNGIKYTKCVTCGAEKAELTAKKDHSYGEWEVMVQPKCGAQGVEKQTCECGAYVVKTIDALTHDIKTTETKATCTQAGVKVDKCQRTGCDYEKTVVTQPTGHKLDGGAVHEHTCTTGKYTVYTCTNTDENTGKKCDYQSFELAAGEEGKALGHDFANEITVEGKTKAATCTEDGLKVMQCSRCDETEDVVIPKLGHNFDVSGDPVLPTCTTSGYTVMKCTHDGCTETYNEYDENKPALGHLWGEWKVTKASTNTEEGQIEHSCTREGCEAKEIAEIPAGGHSFENAVGEVIVAATCKNKGETKYTCTAHKDADGNNTCGVSITVETEKLPHKLKTEVTYPKCERIQNADGTYTDKFTAGEIKVFCTDCKHVDNNATISLAKPTDHDWSDFQVHTGATCGKAGKYVRYCKKCGAADYKDIPATGKHNFKATTVDATCEERGYTIYACVGCGMTYRDEFTPVLGHDYDDGVAVAATCTTAGGMKYTCKRVFKSEKIVDGEKVTVEVPCGHVKFVEDPNQPAIGHNLTDWEYVTHPSDKNAYAKHRHCQNVGCTYSEYETGAGADHEIKGVNAYYQVNFYNEWVTDEYETLTQNEIDQNPIAYTKLAKTYKTEKLASIYVLKGTEAEYPGKVPVRGKDINYGGYDFEGWTDKKGFGRSLKHEPEERESSEGLIIDLSNINANTEAYALFRSKDVYYTVCFANPYNNQGSTRLTKDFKILHGHEITFSKDGKPYDYKPSMAENNQVKYEFTGWNYDIAHIYDNVTVIARYNAIKKVYTLVYHDYDGNIVGRESITYGGAAQNVPTVAEKPEDDTYIYRNLNKWTLADKTTEVNLSNFTSVPENAKEGDEIHIYSRQDKRLKIYKVQFIVFDPYGQAISGASVQILDSRGQLAATATSGDYGVANVELTYSTAYTVKISRGNYAKEGTFSLIPVGSPSKGISISPAEGTRTYQCYVDLENYTGEEMPVHKKCGCVCHTFLSGIWIFTMNLLYQVFKIRHVCCYDMFVVHGDKLKYGSN